MDAAKFQTLYERHSSPVFRYAYRLTGNAERAEEVLQETFLELLGGKFAESQDSNLKAWLYSVARNKSLSLLKRDTLARAALAEDCPADEAEGRDAERALISHEDEASVRALETALPADLRDTWGLRKQGLGLEEIAARLAIPLGTVKSRMHRLVRHARKELKIES